jgi:hypothetical protein
LPRLLTPALSSFEEERERSGSALSVEHRTSNVEGSGFEVHFVLRTSDLARLLTPTLSSVEEERGRRRAEFRVPGSEFQPSPTA